MIRRNGAILAILLMALTACGDTPPVRIGFVGTLSGRHSEVGVAARNGLQLLVDEVNEAGGINGRPIEVDARDDLGNPDTCREILDSMMDDGIKFVIGPLFSKMANVTLQSIVGRDVLVITPTMSTDLISAKDDNLLRISSTTAKQAVQLAEYAFVMGLKSVAVVYDLSNRGYTEILYNKFERHALSRDMKMSLSLALDKDHRPEMLPIARKLVAAKPDGILMCLSAVDAANLSQQIRKVGGKMQLFGVSWSQTDDLLSQGGKAVEGMVLVSTKPYDNPTPAAVDFEKRYEERYKESASFVSSRAYDAVGLLVRGMQKADDITPEKVKAAILSTKEYQGLNGTVRMDRFGDNMAGYYIVTVKNGRYVSAD